MGVKVTVVGGGSTYTPELVEGFVTRGDRLPVDDLVLLDIDPERLAIVGALADRMLRHVGWAGNLTLTGDRDAALEGADFVIVQLRVGGQAARFQDETIPLRFGCIGQETTGAGGFAKALRTVPMVLELAEETARRGNPGAWFVDFTNPTGLVTQALLDDGHRALGLCNVAIGFQRRFAAHFDVGPEQVRLEHVGLNHLTWERKVLVDGVDRLPEILDSAIELVADESDMPAELIREIGAIPSYYLHYYYLTERVLEQQRTGKTRAEEVMEIDGAVPNLPDDAVVEVAARVDREGAHPLPVDPLPPEMLGLVEHAKAYELLTARAAMSGDRRDALKALMTNPLIGDYDTAKPLLGALLDANRVHLPRFFPGN